MSSLGHTFVKPASRLQYSGLVIFTQWRHGSLPLANFRALASFFHFLPAGDLVSEGTRRDAKLSRGFGLIALEASDS